jgi:hypothetical protein
MTRHAWRLLRRQLATSCAPLQASCESSKHGVEQQGIVDEARFLEGSRVDCAQ